MTEDTKQVKEMLSNLYNLDLSSCGDNLEVKHFSLKRDDGGTSLTDITNDGLLKYEIDRFEEHTKGANGANPLGLSYDFEDTKDLEKQWEEFNEEVNREALEERYKKVATDLSECVAQLANLDYKTIQEFVKANLQDEVEQLRINFKRDFAKVPKQDKLRLETLHLLARLGIMIYEEPEEL